MASTNKTANLGLNQWVGTDPVLMADFNRDNSLLDEAVAKCGNCRVVTGSYVGTGVYGSANHCSLLFEGTPLFVCVGTDACGFAVQHGRTALYQNVDQSTTISIGFTWSGGTMAWWSNAGASEQNNTAGRTYAYTALLAADEA